ncbi:MAG: precorrin-4 C(11)-methyltransferase [Candidatus Omnitrophica bacterium]|nr:precorrin-4 C(11)-methyltransferase [Candidatus Omnitrophota bacterium]
MIVYFIGAGPGDPELLTVKAKKIIRAADIIIYAGSLINGAILKLARDSALIYDSSRMALEEVLGIMRKAQSTKKIIARVHSGDPSLYGAIQEQILWCEKEKVSFEVIPGVSSFCAGAAALKQELTLPDISQTVIITRLSGKTKVPKKEDLQALARIRATLVIFLSVQNIDKVAKQLMCGYNSNTPVAVVSKASWPDEKIIKGNLKDISKKVRQADIKRQALIFIGDVLKRKGFKKSKLYDKGFTHSYRKVQNDR